MQIPFCGPTYQGRSSNIDASRAVNFYPELPGTPDNKSQIVMAGTPGVKAWAMGIGGFSTAVRGLHTFNGVLYGVVYNKLYSFNSSGVASAALGTLSTNTGRVQFANNGVTANGVGGNQLIIVDGTNGYIYNVNTTAFTTISGGGWPGAPDQVEYLDGYFIVTKTGSMAYFVSNLYDGTTWGSLAFASINATPDTVQTVVNHRQQLFFLKTLSTEVWYNAGVATSVGSPFARSSGAVYDYGCAARWSVAKGAQSFYFLCTQRSSDGGEVIGVAEVTDNAPVTISTPAISYKVSTSSTIANCFGYCYSDSGHMFYVLTNPDDDWTIVYDATTKMWHERSSITVNTDSVKRHLSNCYGYAYGKHFVGDYRAANIYEMSSQYYTDNGLDIVAFRTAQTISDKMLLDDVFISTLVVDAETGVGTNTASITSQAWQAGYTGSANILILANGSITGGAIQNSVATPMAYLSWSNDDGHTWSSEYGQSMGAESNYGRTLKWRRLGRARGRVFKIRMSDPIKKIIINAFVEAGK